MQVHMYKAAPVQQCTGVSFAEEEFSLSGTSCFLPDYVL